MTVNKIKIILVALVVILVVVYLVKFLSFDNQKRSKASTTTTITLKLINGATPNIVKVQAKGSVDLSIVNLYFKMLFDAASNVTGIRYIGTTVIDGLGDSNGNLVTVNSRTGAGRFIKIYGENPSLFILPTAFTDIAEITFDKNQTAGMVSIPLDSNFTFTAYNSSTGINTSIAVGGPYELGEAVNSSSSSSSSSRPASSSSSSSSRPVASSSSSSSRPASSSSSSAPRSSSSSSSSSQAASSSSSTPARSSSSSSRPAGSFSSSSSSAGSTAATLVLKVKLQGVVQKPISDTLATLPFKVEIVGNGISGGSLATTIQFTAYDQDDDHKGIWKNDVPVPLTGVALGNDNKYTIYVKGPKHLQRKVCDLQPVYNAEEYYSCAGPNISFKLGENVLDFTGILMYAGDIAQQGHAQNGIINIIDIGFVDTYIDKAQYDPDCDFNQDGKCDVQDHSLMMASMAEKYDEN